MAYRESYGVERSGMRRGQGVMGVGSKGQVGLEAMGVKWVCVSRVGNKRDCG